MTWPGRLFLNRNVAALYPEGLAVNYGVGYLLMGSVDQTVKGRLGNTHLVCGLFLRKSEEVLKPHRLYLILSDEDLLNRPQGYTCRFEKH